MPKQKQINTNTKDRLRPQKRLFSNKAIVVIKIAAACILFFACCLFFFENTTMFYNDILSFNPFPLVFFIGIFWVSFFIINLVSKIEDKNLYLADRLDWLYKVIFIITILSMVVRSMLEKPYLNVPIEIIVLGIISGVLTLITPKIVDNDNQEF